MNIGDYAHLSKGGSDWTEAFRAAVSDLSSAGGGVLRVSAGIYPTGSIRLSSHITLLVEAGAKILFIQAEDKYPLIDLEFEGRDEISYQPCIFIEDAEFVKITGDGMIDGQGEFWWDKVRNKTLKHPRPRLVCISRSKHVTIENVVLTRSPAWTVHPLRSRDIIVRGVRIINPADSPNTDGVNPDACKDVRIHDCTIDVGDDCIAIKSGTEKLQNKESCERIVISNCHFLHGHGGIVLGSEMSGGIRNVLVTGCIFYETDRGVRLKTRRGRGGEVEGIQLSNLIMENVMCPFVFNMYYFCGPDGKEERVWDKNPRPADESTPVLRDVSITNVSAKKCGACAAFFYGLPEMPVQGVAFSNIFVEMDKDAPPALPAMMTDCPEMQSQGLFLRNARGVTLMNVTVTGLKGPLLDADGSAEVINRE